MTQFNSAVGEAEVRVHRQPDDRPSASARSRKPPKIKVSSNYLQTIYRRLSLATVLIPLLGTVVAIGLLPYTGLSSVAISVAVSFYAITILGIEVGYHRLFSHRSFQANTPVRVLLAVFGSMAAQGGPIFWVAHHRRHHQFTDKPGDPHSPHLHGLSFGEHLRGLWHSHMGWTFEGEVTNSALFAKDLLREKAISRVNQLQHVWVLLGILVPTVLVGVLTTSWIGALQGFLWGGLVRICLGQHIINSTNSIGHLFGSAPYHSDDYSTNNAWLAIPSWGQSWHNNHHAFPTSAIAGLHWWQIDPGTWFIRALERTGWIWDVQVPSGKALKARER